MDGKAAHQVSCAEESACKLPGFEPVPVRLHAQRRLSALPASPEKRILMRGKA